MLCCSAGVQCAAPAPDPGTLELARTTSAAGDHPNRLLHFRLLYRNPVLVFVSMDPVWGRRGGLTVLWITTWESRLLWPVLVSMSTGCKDCRGHPLRNASQIKGSYLLSSRRHHKPWRSCRAFENVSLCPGAFPSTAPGLRNKEGKPSCNAKSLWRSNLPDGNAWRSKGGLEGQQEMKECLVTPHSVNTLGLKLQEVHLA